MCFYSKVVTIRDKQLIENKKLEQEWIDEQKKLDLMMEIERLKALSEEEKRNLERKAAIKRGAQVIIDQIGERELQRMKEQEIREKEKLMIKRNVEEMERQEEQKIREKMEKAKAVAE